MKQLSSSELNSMTKEDLASMVLQMQQQIHTLNEKIAVMNARHFGRSTEKLETLPGQMNIFNSGEQNAIVACVTKLTRLKISATNGHRPEKSCAGAEI